MSKCTRVLLCRVMLALFPAIYCSAQSERATLSGRVTDPSGAAVPDAKVESTNTDTNITSSTQTNGDGLYVLPSLLPGPYRVSVMKQGFKTITIIDLVLHVQDSIAQNFALPLGSVSESITVAGGASLINTESTSVSTVVDRQFVENMPLNGRSLQSLIALTPGVVLVPSSGSGGQFSINGQRADANYLTVDGVSGNIGNSLNFAPGNAVAGTLLGLTTFGGTNNLVSIDALQEFRVETSSYSAEFGRMPGGQITLATRSGTNQFRGTASEYLRNEVFDANDWFANRSGNPKAALRQNDYGGVFGGPVWIPRLYDGRNRTFFFASYEGLRLQTPQFGLTNVPTMALRQTAPAALQPILNSWPVPNGRDLGNGLAEYSAGYSDQSWLHATSFRVDQRFGNRLTVFGRFNYAPSRSSSRVVNINFATIQLTEQDTQTLTVGATIQLSNRAVVELRANKSGNLGSASLYPDSAAGTVPVPRSLLIADQYAPPGTSAQATVFLDFPGRTVTASPRVDVDDARASQQQVNLVGSTSVTLGQHQVKFGADYRRLAPVLQPRGYILSIHFTTQADVLKGIANTAAVSNAGVKEIPVFQNLSLFAQDAWKVSSRLTLNLGMRWELNPPPKDKLGNDPATLTEVTNLAKTDIAPRGTPLWKTTYANFAPRAGLAFMLRDKPGRETVLRSSLGIFYDTGTGQASAGYFGYGFRGLQPFTNVQFPLNFTQLAPAPPILTKPYTSTTASDPDLKLPYVVEWNVSVEQAISRQQAMTVGYSGARGHRLLEQRQLSLQAINPAFTTLMLITNDGNSDYDALQVQYRHRLSRGLQALVSYSWSHAIDTVSSDFSSTLLLRGNADFDLRHNFAAAVTYELPAPRVGARLLGGWAVDTRFSARSSLPFNVSAGTFTDTNGTVRNIQPNLVLGVPVYLHNPSFPGGRIVNVAAFSIPTGGQVIGDLGRNVIRGFDAWQTDFAARRKFKISERVSAQLRAEAFNLFNHPNFGAINASLTAINFGYATNMLGRQLGGLSSLYQIGGPRSMQLALKLQF